MTVVVEGFSDTPEPTVSTESLASALADAQVEAAHVLQQEAAVEAAQESAEAALEIAADQQFHSHPELDLTPIHSRLDDISTRMERMEAVQLAQQTTAETPVVEELTPAPEVVEEPTTVVESSPPAHHGMRRGR